MTIAIYLDYALFVTFAGTVALILFKCIQLWAPQLFKEPRISERLQLQPSEFSRYLEDVESGLAVLAVIAATAPFIGLMGTVLHIVAALSKISTSLDASIISGPIATALNATLVGLASAVPAAAAHTLFWRRIEVLQRNFDRKEASHD